MVLQCLCSLVTESTLESSRASLGECFVYKISSRKLEFLKRVLHIVELGKRYRGVQFLESKGDELYFACVPYLLLQ